MRTMVTTLKPRGFRRTIVRAAKRYSSDLSEQEWEVIRPYYRSVPLGEDVNARWMNGKSSMLSSTKFAMAVSGASCPKIYLPGKRCTNTSVASNAKASGNRSTTNCVARFVYRSANKLMPLLEVLIVNRSRRRRKAIILLVKPELLHCLS
jgi:hypothetical protein